MDIGQVTPPKAKRSPRRGAPVVVPASAAEHHPFAPTASPFLGRTTVTTAQEAAHKIGSDSQGDGFVLRLGAPDAPALATFAMPHVEADTAVWIISGSLTRTRGGLGVTGFTFTAVDHERFVTAQLLRSVPLAKIIARAKTQLALHATLTGARAGWNYGEPERDRLVEVAEAASSAAQAPETRGRGRPRTVTDAFLRRFALELLDDERRRGPSGSKARLRRRYPARASSNHEFVSIDTVRGWVRQATDAGFLAPVGQGYRAGHEAGLRLGVLSQEG